MLRHTFLHIKGIGEKTEQLLWKRGIHTWTDFLESPRVIFTQGKDAMIKQDLEDSVNHLDDVAYFEKRLSAGEKWRLFSEYGNNAVYLDIETTGPYAEFDEITVIGLYDGDQSYIYVSGINLEEFENQLAKYDLVVTYNGSGFDLPVIKRHFPHACIPPGHIDLRYVLARLGFSGGLKKIEKKVGLARVDDIAGMSGMDAPILWQKYQNGDQKALDLLVEYNKADIENLKPLMELAYKRHAYRTGL